MINTQSNDSVNMKTKRNHDLKMHYALSQFCDAAYGAIRSLVDNEGYLSLSSPEKTQVKIAEKVGKSKSWVSRKLGDPGECTQRALAVFAGNYNKRIVISLVEPGHEKMVNHAVQILDTYLPMRQDAANTDKIIMAIHIFAEEYMRKFVQDTSSSTQINTKEYKSIEASFSQAQSNQPNLPMIEIKEI